MSDNLKAPNVQVIENFNVQNLIFLLFMFLYIFLSHRTWNLYGVSLRLVFNLHCFCSAKGSPSIPV
jgi:hypothetical protein